MTNDVHSFVFSDSGAVTVDWTVLTAGIVGLSLTTVAAVRSGVLSLGDDINAALSSAEVADVLPNQDPTAGLNLDTATGYRDQEFYFFTTAGVNNWYRNNVKNLSDDALLAALDTRAMFMASEMAMGPDDAPSYGQPWGHTDMHNLTLWEAAYRGLL